MFNPQPRPILAQGAVLKSLLGGVGVGKAIIENMNNSIFLRRYKDGLSTADS
jgi:hypothetical protein